MLSYISIESDRDGGVVVAQDTEFEQAVAEAQENQRRAVDIAAEIETEQNMRLNMRIEIEREFLAIPVPPDQAEAVAIRFQFPDNSSLTRRFFQNGPIHWLFIFVRKFVFPQEFVLLTGFPLTQIAENESPINSIGCDRSFVITIEYVEGFMGN